MNGVVTVSLWYILEWYILLFARYMSKLCPQPYSDRGIWKAVIVNSFYRVPTLFKQKNPQLFKIILKERKKKEKEKSHIQTDKHSSVTVHWERFQENWKFWTEYGVSVVFIYTRKLNKITHLFNFNLTLPVEACTHFAVETAVTALPLHADRFHTLTKRQSMKLPTASNSQSQSTLGVGLHWEGVRISKLGNQ